MGKSSQKQPVFLVGAQIRCPEQERKKETRAYRFTWPPQLHESAWEATNRISDLESSFGRISTPHIEGIWVLLNLTDSF